MTTKYKGALFFDVDGTLIEESVSIFQVTPNVKNALSQLKNQGYLIAVSTGRARSYLANIGFDFDGYVCNNGAYVEICGEEILRDCIVREDLETIIALFDSLQLNYILEGAKHGYYPVSTGEIIKKNILDSYQIDFSTFSPFESIDGLKIDKFMCCADREEVLDALQKNLPAGFEFMRHRGHLSGDLSRTSLSKGTGVDVVMRHLQLDKSTTYAFGDNINDRDMLACVGHGIAMTPHAKELESVAEYITQGVKEDGICTALKHFQLL